MNIEGGRIREAADVLALAGRLQGKRWKMFMLWWYLIIFRRKLNSIYLFFLIFSLLFAALRSSLWCTREPLICHFHKCLVVTSIANKRMSSLSQNLILNSNQFILILIKMCFLRYHEYMSRKFEFNNRFFLMFINGLHSALAIVSHRTFSATLSARSPVASLEKTTGQVP